MVRLETDPDVHALSRGYAALYWHRGEHTQPAVILGSCGTQQQNIHPSTVSQEPLPLIWADFPH